MISFIQTIRYCHGPKPYEYRSSYVNTLLGLQKDSEYNVFLGQTAAFGTCTTGAEVRCSVGRVIRSSRSFRQQQAAALLHLSTQ